MAERIAEGVVQIDTQLGGWDHVTAGYLLDGPIPVLIETGSQTSVPALLGELGLLGLGAQDLAAVIVTHIHLDHAGGVGDVANAFPNATVYVHEQGAPHLVDPTKLISSAERVYGGLLDELYGRLTPTAAQRVKVLDDGDKLSLGLGRELTSINTPGHAKHHLSLHDSLSGVMFVGDAVGVRLPEVGVLRPSTPPPDFDLELALASLQAMGDRSPSGVALAHYGLVPDPDDVFHQAAGALMQWAEVAGRAFASGEDIAAALDVAFGEELAATDETHRHRLDMLNGIHSNAAGFRRRLTLQEQAK